MSVLLVKVLTMVVPFKVNLYQMCTGENATLLPNSWNYGIVTPLAIFTCFLSIVFPKIQAVLGIFGGIASSNIMFFVPLYIYISLSNKSIWTIKNISITIFFSFMCLIGWYSAYISVINVINASSS